MVPFHVQVQSLNYPHLGTPQFPTLTECKIHVAFPKRCETKRCSPISRARRDVILPLSQPIVGLDGTEIHEIFVPKGTLLTVAILRANRDPEMWGDDAQEWNPDRWLSPLPDSLTDTPFPGIFSNMSVALFQYHSFLS